MITGGSSPAVDRMKFNSNAVNTRPNPSTNHSPQNALETSGGRGGAASRNITGIGESSTSENYTGKLKNALGAGKKSNKKSTDSKSPGKAPTHGVGLAMRNQHTEAYNQNTRSLKARVLRSEGLSVGTATDTGTATSRAKV